MSTEVTLIPGDGTGPVLVECARRVLDATGVGVSWDLQEAGRGTFEREGDPLPERVLDSLRTTSVALKGPLSTPVEAPYPNVNLTLRQALDLYAGVRPSRLFPGVPSPYEGVDVVVVREMTEGMYTGIEFEEGAATTKELIEFIREETGRTIRDRSGISIKHISVHGSERITRFAMRWAVAHGRSKVTAAHKANIMKFSDGLFLETARRVARDEFPEVQFDDRIIDACCMQLASAPERFDVLVLPNMYGDIVADLCAGLIGGLGLAPGGTFGEDVAVFEAVHGTGPRIKDPRRADPSALILSGAMLLRHVGEPEAADAVERAVAAVLADGSAVTYDLRPRPGDPAASASEMTDAVVGRLTA
ncbi:MAG: isocitrate/isopropylmalate family dehydrogenase [Actinomycetota bacterium]